MKQRILKLNFITQHKQLSNKLKWQLFFSQRRYDSQLVCYSALTSSILLKVRLQDCSYYSSFVQLFFSLSLLTNKQSYQQLIQQIELTEKWLHQSLLSILLLLISCEVFRKTFSQRHSYLTSPPLHKYIAAHFSFTNIIYRLILPSSIGQHRTTVTSIIHYDQLLYCWQGSKVTHQTIHIKNGYIILDVTFFHLHCLRILIYYHILYHL